MRWEVWNFFRISSSGVSLGSVYAIIALGYTMVYGIAKMLNFAHGDVIMVGGYISLLRRELRWGCPWPVAVMLSQWLAAPCSEWW